MADDLVTRAWEILNRHCEYVDGLDRGQRYIGTDKALAAVKEALSQPSDWNEAIEAAAKLADEWCAKARKLADDNAGERHESEFEHEAIAAENIAAAIRNLKRTEQGGAGA